MKVFISLVLIAAALFIIIQPADARWVNRYCWDSYTNQTYVCGGFDDGIYPYVGWPYYPPYGYYRPYYYPNWSIHWGWGHHNHHHHRHHRR